MTTTHRQLRASSRLSKFTNVAPNIGPHQPSALESALSACDDIDRAHDPIDAPGTVHTARIRLLRHDVTGRRLRNRKLLNQAMKRRALRNNPNLRTR